MPIIKYKTGNKNPVHTDINNQTKKNVSDVKSLPSTKSHAKKKYKNSEN